jgi:hypothetical protein
MTYCKKANRCYRFNWPNRDPFGERGFDVLQSAFLKKRAPSFQKPVEFFGGGDAYDFVINDPIDGFDLMGLSPGTARPSGPPQPPPTHICSADAIISCWPALLTPAPPGIRRIAYVACTTLVIDCCCGGCAF